jgi:hypothetical protein
MERKRTILKEVTVQKCTDLIKMLMKYKTLNSDMVIRSTRLNYAEILARLCKAVS